jgi:site-specific DNA-adenine methylase
VDFSRTDLQRWGKQRAGSRWLGIRAFPEQSRDGQHGGKNLARIDGLAAVHQRLRNLQIECGPWQRIVDRYDDPSACLYFDPPYVPETRRDGGYTHDLTTGEHAEVVDRLLKLRAQAVVSGYPHPMYEALDRAGWQRLERTRISGAAGRTRRSRLLGFGSATGAGQIRREATSGIVCGTIHQ